MRNFCYFKHSISDESLAKIKRNISETHEAYLDYYGEPNADDDPADYRTYTKGVRVA